MNDLDFPGFFIWSDGHLVTFTYWAPGEPNNHAGYNEDCVEMLHQVSKKNTPTHQLNTRQNLTSVHRAWKNPSWPCNFQLLTKFFALTCGHFDVNVVQTGRWNDVTCSELNTYICKMPKGHYPVPSVKPTVYGCPQVRQTLLFFLLRLRPELWCLLKRELQFILCIDVRAGTHTATPATGWRRLPGAGRRRRSSVKARTASWCTSETCEPLFS